jgi:hypothetical protein
LFGFLGVLLALPVAAVGMVLLREAHRQYLASELYGAPVMERPMPAAADASPDAVGDDAGAAAPPAAADAPPAGVRPMPPGEGIR